MDLLLSPKTTTQRDQTSRLRFAFKRFSVSTEGQSEYSGFCYIGRNSGHMDRLVKLYLNGYASESLQFARTELLRHKQQIGRVPEFIICEGHYNLGEMAAFGKFLKGHADFRNVAFIIDGSGLSGGEMTTLKEAVRPDDIVLLQQMGESELSAKLQFLHRVKRAGQETKPQIEEYRQLDLNLRKGLIFKRAFDICVSSIAIILLLPVLLLIALAIKLESKGPIFYIAKRAGRGYKIFNFYKFRTMVKDADKKVNELKHLNQYNAANGPVFFKISNDPRITRVGKFLRNTSLDELPQLFNVFLGDMSLVGNRPLPLYEAVSLTTDDYAARFLAPAGITGLWQIKKRGNKEMSVEERITIDIDYAARCSFATDLWIIANTPTALMQKENV
jgi:lipopolysaccharide/colanic/teichoic acid biosynthesis glycosyltransferase